MESAEHDETQNGGLSYEDLINVLQNEENALTKIASSLSSASHIGQELQDLLASNQGKRPKFLPGVGRRRMEALRLDTLSPKKGSDEGEEVHYVPKLRPCACGCGAMVLGEAGCAAEVQPLRRPNVEESNTSPKRRVEFVSAQKASCERLHHRKPHAAPAPAASPSPKASSPSKLIDPARLNQMAKPREPPAPPQEIIELPPARPAPDFSTPKIMPRQLRRARSEASLLADAAPKSISTQDSPLQYMASAPAGRRKVFKLNPSQSELPGLSMLLQRASLAEPANPPVLKLHQFADERRPEPVRTKKSQNSYVDARLYPKATGVKAGSAADLALRLERVRQERLELEREMQEGRR